MKDSIKEVKDRFKPTTDEEMDSEYPILSVSNDGRVSLNEYRKGEEFTQAYKRVHAEDIVYNPYRVNIGSIGVVPSELDGAYVSPAYVVFHYHEHRPDYIVDLLRSPFYKLYIDVVATGSIRDSLAFGALKAIRIPKLGSDNEMQIVGETEGIDTAIQTLEDAIEKQKSKRIEEIHNMLRSYMAKKTLGTQGEKDNELGERSQ